MVALDMSGSMAAEDFEIRGKRVNRFEMARVVLKKFIEKRPNDRIGLVVFATQAYVSTPLTLDHDFLNSNLDRLKLGDIDQNRTAIGSAISTAVNRLREVQSKSKIAIVMTDGQNNSGKVPPLTAAEAAQALGTKVYTIGVGTHGQAPVPAGRNPFTGETMYQMQAVDIDEDTLKEVAKKTGAQYFRADNAEKFEAIYAEIDQLEKTEKEVKKYRATPGVVRVADRSRAGVAVARNLVAPYVVKEIALMRFANPQVLWLLLVLPPLLLVFLVWAWKARQKLLTEFVQARLLPGLLAGVSPARVKIRAALLCLAVVFLIVALARPQWGFRWEEVKMRGLDIVVAIDTSRSMLAEDIAPNRLARAKLAALDLVQQAKTDRLGLVAFAGSAFLQCPLDHR